MTMQVRKAVFKPTRGHDWTRERIEQLSKRDIEQLRINAQTLGEAAVIALCDEALKARPREAKKPDGARAQARQLISRSKAFQARGVFLQDERTSWSGVRKADGGVVMALWASAVVPSEGGWSHLLWAPNVDGSRPWSDTTAGRERLEHCKLALNQGGAEGLLVHGEPLDGHMPEHKARSIRGVDPAIVVSFQIELRGDQYWAVWGKKAGQAAR